jgi:hypothetical protein
MKDYFGADELGARRPGRERQQRYEASPRGRLMARLRKQRQRQRERAAKIEPKGPSSSRR